MGHSDRGELRRRERGRGGSAPAVLFAMAVLAGGLLLASCGGSSGGAGGELLEVPTGTQFHVEEFLDTSNRDADATDGDWGSLETGILRGQAVTSRTAYVFGYEETESGVNSGRGQYVPLDDLLVGTDQGTLPPPMPPVSQGRRVLISIPDSELGSAGAITGLGWGPAANQTSAANYPAVKIRLGYLDASVAPPRGLSPTSIAASYADTPTLVYDGSYSVPQGSVANTPGYPMTAHIGSYPQNFGCTSVGAGWNSQLYGATGFYAWPALTSTFEWDPGDPQTDDDSVLLVDVSVQTGNISQSMRGWFAVTFPCSGILIGGFPEQRLAATYEGDAPNPADNHPAGIVNPAPVIPDTCITFTRRKSVAQSRFFEGAYGDDTDYESPVLVPAAQVGSAQILVEFQGADAIEADGVTVDESSPFTAWTTDVHQCDGMKYLRYRVCLISDLDTTQVARLDRITIGMSDSNP